MAWKAVFLDLGGTLMDPTSDAQAHREMMKALREAAALTRSANELWERYHGLHTEQIRRLGTRWQVDRVLSRTALARLLRDEGRVLEEDHWDAFQAAYWREHLRWLRMFPETGEVLENLRELPVHVGLLSDIDEDFLQICLYVYPLDRFLDSMTTSEEAGVAKPDPTIFHLALTKAGCRGRDAIHVGDSRERDAEGARAVEMTTVLLDPSGEEGAADYVVPDLKAANEVLKDLVGVASP